MKLVPFSSQYLKRGDPLPFGLRDASGRLLLGAGLAINSEKLLGELSSQQLFAEESEAADWNRRLNAAVDTALRSGASLAAVAAVRPEEAQVREAPTTSAARTLAEHWQELVAQLDAALRDVRADTDWRSKMFAVHLRARQMYQKKPDGSLYHMIYEAGQSTRRYSSHHAVLSLLIAEQAAGLLGWPQPTIDSLGRAALTMNLSIRSLQDQLALRPVAPNEAMRVELETHPAVSARQLHEAGLSDPVAQEIVRLHHDAAQSDQALAGLPAAKQAALLLRRVDMFAAKLSRRESRAAMSPAQAAREACIGPSGAPDEIGGALLKAVGLYPPGSFVELASGELGIVVARGVRANLPYVATLVSAAGNPLGEPALRDTIDRRYAVKGPVAAATVRVLPPHERLLAMR